MLLIKGSRVFDLILRGWWRKCHIISLLNKCIENKMRFGNCKKCYTKYGLNNIEASSRCSKQSLTIVFTPGNCCHFQFGSSSSSLSIRVSFIFHLSHCPDFQVTSPCVILIYQAIYTDITPNGLYCYIALLMGWKTPIYR